MKRVSSIPIEYGKIKYLELQNSLEKLPKTKEGIAEAHASRAVIRRPFGLLYSKITATFLYRKMRVRMLFRFSHSRKTRPPSCTDELWPSSCTDPVLYPRPVYVVLCRSG